MTLAALILACVALGGVLALRYMVGRLMAVVIALGENLGLNDGAGASPRPEG